MAAETFIIEIRTLGTARAAQQIRQIRREATATQQALRFLRAALVVLASVEVSRRALDVVDAYVRMGNQLRLVTADQSNLNRVMQELVQVSRRTRSSLEENISLFAKVTRATEGMGLSQQDVLQFTESVNQAVQISGVRANTAAAGLQQFAQALSSGVLGGDELRSVTENLPRIAATIAKEFGIAAGELRSFNEANRNIISPERIFRAFIADMERLNLEFAKVNPTIESAFVVLKDSLTIAIGQLNEAFEITDRLTRAILGLADNSKIVTSAFLALATSILLVFVPALIRAITHGRTALLGFVPLLGAISVVLGTFRDDITIGDDFTTIGDLGEAAFLRIRKTFEGTGASADSFRKHILNTTKTVKILGTDIDVTRSRVEVFQERFADDTWVKRFIQNARRLAAGDIGLNEILLSFARLIDMIVLFFEVGFAKIRAIINQFLTEFKEPIDRTVEIFRNILDPRPSPEIPRTTAQRTRLEQLGVSSEVARQLSPGSSTADEIVRDVFIGIRNVFTAGEEIVGESTMSLGEALKRVAISVGEAATSIDDQARRSIERAIVSEPIVRPFRQGEFVEGLFGPGTRSTEISRTFQDLRGVWMNAPALWMTPDGPVLLNSDDEIRRIASAYESKTGLRFPRFGSEQEAVAAAIARSDAGGVFSGELAQPVSQGRILGEAVSTLTEPLVSAVQAEADAIVGIGQRIRQAGAQAQADVLASGRQQIFAGGGGPIESEIREILKMARVVGAGREGEFDELGDLLGGGEDTRRAKADEEANKRLKKREQFLRGFLGQLFPVSAALREQAEAEKFVKEAFAAGDKVLDEYGLQAEDFVDVMDRVNEKFADVINPMRVVNRMFDEQMGLIGMTEREQEIYNLTQEVTNQLSEAYGRSLLPDEVAEIERRTVALIDSRIANERMNDEIRDMGRLLDDIQGGAAAVHDEIMLLNKLFEQGSITLDQYNRRLRELNLELLDIRTDAIAGFERGFLKAQQSMTDFAAVTESIVTTAFDGIGDSISDAFDTALEEAKDLDDFIGKFVDNAKVNFAELIAEIGKLLIKLGIRQVITGVFGGNSIGGLGQSLFGGGSFLGNLLGGNPAGAFGQANQFFGGGRPALFNGIPVGGFAAATGVSNPFVGSNFNDSSFFGGIGSFFSNLFGGLFQTGGAFTVPGSGGPDSSMAALRLTPGEKVVVLNRRQQRLAGPSLAHVESIVMGTGGRSMGLHTGGLVGFGAARPATSSPYDETVGGRVSPNQGIGPGSGGAATNWTFVFPNVAKPDDIRRHQGEIMTRGLAVAQRASMRNSNR